MAMIVGCILAGGLSRRMGGGDKGLMALGGRPILELVIERMGPQVDTLILNANGKPARFSSFGLPVVPDSIEGHMGPLAGVLAVLEWSAAHAPEARSVATAATDTPFFPRDLVVRLKRAQEGRAERLAVAASNGRLHPVFALWPVSLAAELRRDLSEGQRQASAWVERRDPAVVDFPAADYDPFFNVNRPADLAEAERIAEAFRP
ncbi:MAG: molybdenum cofactor guanylyltransferase MobA [Parvibaculaceae bacterium]